jgi:hypothetical protein
MEGVSGAHDVAPAGVVQVMSTILPQGAVAKVQFFENRQAVWTERAAEIGATTGAVAQVAATTEAARAAYEAQSRAHQQAMAATQAFHDAMAAMAQAGAVVIKQVKTYAAGEGGEAVYPLAMLPAPARPSRLPPPGMPTNFTVTLRPNGSLLLKWRCRNPAGSSGTMYQVARRVGEMGAFESIGVIGAKSFVDSTVPAGAASLIYQITAVRSTAAGVAARFIVNFGVTAGAGTGTGIQTRRAA